MFFDTIILAIIQALTEFLPISSSGHLILAQELGELQSSIGLDVMLHFGTLIAVVVYFWSDLIGILKELIEKKSSNLLVLLVIATIPAVIIGGLFENKIDELFRNIEVVTFMLFTVGLFMLIYEKYAPKIDKKLRAEKLSNSSALKIGLWQALAFIPGTSRSGITILAGRWQKLSLTQAARFSFLIGIPAIAAATLKILLEDESRAYISDNLSETIVGIAISAILGYLAISLLLGIVKKYGLKPFGWYRIALSVVLVAILVTK